MTVERPSVLPACPALVLVYNPQTTASQANLSFKHRIVDVLQIMIKKMMLSFAGMQRTRKVTLCKQAQTSNLRDWANFSLNGQHCLFLSLLLLFVPFAHLPPPPTLVT